MCGRAGRSLLYLRVSSSFLAVGVPVDNVVSDSSDVGRSMHGRGGVDRRSIYYSGVIDRVQFSPIGFAFGADWAALEQQQ